MFIASHKHCNKLRFVEAQKTACTHKAQFAPTTLRLRLLAVLALYSAAFQNRLNFCCCTIAAAMQKKIIFLSIDNVKAFSQCYQFFIPACLCKAKLFKQCKRWKIIIINTHFYGINVISLREKQLI